MGSRTCKGSETILFGWARDAPPLQLPKGEGSDVILTLTILLYSFSGW